MNSTHPTDDKSAVAAAYSSTTPTTAAFVALAAVALCFAVAGSLALLHSYLKRRKWLAARARRKVFTELSSDTKYQMFDTKAQLQGDDARYEISGEPKIRELDHDQTAVHEMTHEATPAESDSTPKVEMAGDESTLAESDGNPKVEMAGDETTLAESDGSPRVEMFGDHGAAELEAQ